MTTTELIRPPAPPFEELTPLVGAIAGEGPPVILLAGPWILLALVLSGPFAFLLTLVLAMLVAATVIAALAAAVVGVPYLLIRGVRSYRARGASSDDRAAQLVVVPSTRVAA